MSYDQILILLALGALHSASLWAITLGINKGIKSAGRDLKDWTVRSIPVLFGIPSAHYGFPLALHISGGEFTQIHPVMSIVLGLAAAAGSEGMYRAANGILPRLVDILLGKVVK